MQYDGPLSTFENHTLKLLPLTARLRARIHLHRARSPDLGDDLDSASPLPRVHTNKKLFGHSRRERASEPMADHLLRRLFAGLDAEVSDLAKKGSVLCDGHFRFFFRRAEPLE